MLQEETEVTTTQAAVLPGNQILGTSPSSSWAIPHHSGYSVRRKASRKVTFANEPNNGDPVSDVDEEDEEHSSSPMATLRFKRASLPNIELPTDLHKKIKKMNQAEDDVLNEELVHTLKILKEKPDESPSLLKYEYELRGGQLIQIRMGDITEEYVDVIVNEANCNLAHHRGVAGAIAQKGGRDIQLQSDRWLRKYGPVPPGQVAITEGGSLHAHRVIHAVGPIWHGGNYREDTELWDCVWNAMLRAQQMKYKSLAFPAIGVGFLGFPKERCAYLLVDCIRRFFVRYPKSKLQEVRIVNSEPDVTEAFVFEMVGRFTAACETSDSEGASGSDLDEIDMDDVGDDEEEEDTVSIQDPVLAVPSEVVVQNKILDSWKKFSRRQSIA